MTVTVRQVAADAGVSRQTVSNVLNAPARVDPVTRERVAEAIERLGYRPNRAARNLKLRRAGLVGYCVSPRSTPNLLMDAFLHAFCTAVADTGRHVLLFSAPPGEAGIGVYHDLVAERAVDAFVLSDTVADDPRHRALVGRAPVVSFGRADLGSWVDVDGAAACAELVTGLAALGHREIGFLGWRAPETAATADRRAGWQRACAELGLNGRVGLADDDSVAAGERAAGALLDAESAPTALVAISDQVALGALQAVTARGLRPGTDVAVTGFDDTPLAAAVVPGLTSVRQPLDLIAAELVRLLDDSEDQVLLRGKVISRASAPVPVEKGSS
ncbi:LacI family DNA-binding transcriptional regulator [Actinokineospora sp.]|uniref:LacI family DNA-binding transcriptional regulator n=1 Tax=Actinokineospora sp. TaxID=1872133 RepID=UPI004038016D